MLNSRDLKKIQDDTKHLIEFIMDPKNELDFQKKVLKGCPFLTGEYDIFRIHMAGDDFRVTVRNDYDQSEDLFISSTTVFAWYLVRVQEVI
ncbi:hypothetical protein [Vibrio phage RYC]|nr:hypothetical protein [Vibrio phage RYC]